MTATTNNDETIGQNRTATYRRKRPTGDQVRITVTPEIVTAAIHTHHPRDGWSKTHTDTIPIDDIETRSVNQYVQFETSGYSEGADSGRGHLYVLAITPAGDAESFRPNPRLPERIQSNTGITVTKEDHFPNNSSRSQWTERITVHRNDIEDTIEAGGRVLVIETYWDATLRPGNEGNTTLELRNTTELKLAD